MSLSVADNIREPWSRITDTRILRPRDELKLIGASAIATLAVLDAHDPSRNPAAYIEAAMYGKRPLKHHRHVLVQLEGRSQILSTGLYVGKGTADELLFLHRTPSQQREIDYGAKLEQLWLDLGAGMLHGLYFISDQERLTALPEARPYLDDQGTLRM